MQHLALPGPTVASFLFFFPSVVLVSWIAGRGPGLLAMALSTLVGNVLSVGLGNEWSPQASVLIATAVHAATASLVALLCASFRDAFLEFERLGGQHAQAEEILRRQDSTLQQAGQMAHLGAWDLDVRHRGNFDLDTLTWSDEVFRIFGYEPGQVAVSNALFMERVHPEDRPLVTRAIEEAIATRRPYSIAHRVVRPDGSERIVQEHAELVFDESGELIRMIGAVQDVTERKRAEDAVQGSARRLNRAQEIAHLGSWELDLPTNTLTWSDEVYRIFGLEPQEFGATYEAFLAAVHPDDRAAVDAAYSASLREGRDSYELEHRIVRRSNGEVRIVHEKCEHLRDASGRIVRSVGMVHDITERKRAEEALRQANEQLTEADRRKNEFLAMLSHELRNPLAPIRNSLFILGRGEHDAEQVRRAHVVIDRQVRHLTRLVDDLLDITRVTQGRVQIQRERLELIELVRRTVEDHRSVFSESQIDLEIVAADAEIWLDGDRIRLAQAVGNLLTNAAKFTPRGGQTTVTVERNALAGRVMICVEDSGTGVAPELIPRLFQPFAQADTSLARSKGGLGLGLALVKAMVELHGGSVRGESGGPGRGAAFTVTLPIEPLAIKSPPAAPVAAPAVSRRAGRRVLVIDDNIDSADSLREVLELGDHEVQVAYDGHQGLSKAREFRPEIVLCDIGLPGMDGYEVARAFRATEMLRSAYLVALTGYALPEDLGRARAAGFDLHIAKPPSLEKIEQALATAPSGGLREQPG